MEDAIYPIKVRKPVAVETTPVSRRDGQYILQRMVAAEFERRTAKTINITFNIGWFTRKTAKNETQEPRYVIKRVRYIFCFISLYANTATKTVKDMARVATVKIAAAVFGEYPRYSLKYVGSQNTTAVLTTPVRMDTSEKRIICLFTRILATSTGFLRVLFSFLSSAKRL